MEGKIEFTKGKGASKERRHRRRRIGRYFVEEYKRTGGEHTVGRKGRERKGDTAEKRIKRRKGNN